jgi:hypothetical protein
MDPTMGQTTLGTTGIASVGLPAVTGPDTFGDAEPMQEVQSSEIIQAVVVEHEATPPAPPATNYPVGIIDFNKPFQVFDANDDSEIHDNARVLAVLTGNAYPVVIVSEHNGEQVVGQFDTDGDEMNGDLKVENLDMAPRIMFGVLIKQGREYSLSDELFNSERDAHDQTFLSDGQIAAVFPVTIPGADGQFAVVQAVVEGESEEQDDDTNVHVMADPNARWVNGRLIKPGDKVRARKTGESYEQVCTVIKTRDDSMRSLFIQADIDGSAPYWALNKKIRSNY